MDNQVVRVVVRLAEDIGTPRSLAVKLMIEAGEWVQLQQLKCKPKDYADGETYWKDCLITDILRKCDLPTSVDREAAAVDTFFACEKACHTTNTRLTRFLPHSALYENEQDLRVADFISQWRKNVILVMGNLPDTLTPRFSSGSTYADTGLLITTPDKMSSTPTVYSATHDLLPACWYGTSWARSLVETRPWQSRPRTVRGNIFFTVPKDGTKYRGCCKEASINVGLQLDVGRLLKDRIKARMGIDLREGQSHNSELARVGSVDDTFATIDMSNASDTVSRVLVQLLLRGDWYELLSSLRATHTRVEGKWHRLEKFSSMGNGFTFELETLIFATLARTVIEAEGGNPSLVSCYGDDLIVPSGNYKSVIAALRLFGFEPNMKKTFAEGPFRESCGGDFWLGVPVRAHFIENLPDEPHKWISLANGLRRVALANGNNSPRWRIVLGAWLRCLDPIPDRIRRCRGPESLGDVVIHDTPENWTLVPPRKVKEPDGSLRTFAGHSQTYVEGYLPVPNVLPWHHWLPAVQLASCTLGLSGSGVTPRGDPLEFRLEPVAITGSTWLPSYSHRKTSP